MEASDIEALHREADKHAARTYAIRQQIKELDAESLRIQTRIFEIARLLRETENDTTD